MVCVGVSCAECSDRVRRVLDQDALERGLAVFADCPLARGWDRFPGNEHRIGADALELVCREFPSVPAHSTYVQVCEGVHLDTSVHQAANAQRSSVFVHVDARKVANRDDANLRWPGTSKHRERLSNVDEQAAPGGTRRAGSCRGRVRCTFCLR